MMDAFSFIKTDLAENCDFRRNFRVQTQIRSILP